VETPHSREREQGERKPGGDRSAATAAGCRRGSGGRGCVDGELGFVAGGAAEGIFDDDSVVAGVGGPGVGKAMRAGGRAVILFIGARRGRRANSTQQGPCYFPAFLRSLCFLL